MVHSSDLIASDIEAYLSAHEQKDLLRFITCGSVDDGKSTLIGRMLYESKLLFDDHIAQLEADSKRVGTQGGDIDFALLVDGLAAEREQGITIDVAYRFFSTDHRKFIVADTPGHEEYTRNMATGASTAEVAIILVDARHGVLTQTRRHSFITSMVGVRKVLLAVNKLDLVDYSQETYDSIVAEYNVFAEEALNLEEITPIPISALKGDNIIEPSSNTPWYDGPTVMEYLETVNVSETSQESPFRMPVQLVLRPDLDFRGYSGMISSGLVRPGDAIKALPSGKISRVDRIVTWEGDRDIAGAGRSVTLTLEDEVDISRGDVIATADSPCEMADQFQSRILWMSEDAMMPGRQYLFKCGTQTATIIPAKPKHRIDVNTLEELPAKILGLNEIGVCNISLDRRIAFDPYVENRAMGGFIIIDKLSNNTVGMGLIDFALRRADNVHWQAMDVTRASRAEQKSQKPKLVWLTGFSGSGKSSIANVLEKKLQALGKHTITLDGDNVRHGLNRDLGFTPQDRVENIRRISEVANLMLDAGLICITSFISPYQSDRDSARSLVQEGEFVEVFIDTPLDVCEQRDTKGLYAKARAGELPNFTGISSPYEPPANPEVHIKTTQMSVEEAADLIIESL